MRSDCYGKQRNTACQSTWIKRIHQYDDWNSRRCRIIHLWFCSGSWIIVITFLSLLISIWPCLIYGEMSAALPCAGGTYNYAKRGLNRVWANLAGWHYIISVVGIGAGETLAFANYFKILFSQFGIDLSGVDSRIIAIILVIFFLILNFKGIEMSGKAQTGFIFFFWGCAIAWFLYMIPKIHLEYFGGIAMDSLPPFNELIYIFGLVWWCYTGFETWVLKQNTHSIHFQEL